MTKLSIINDFVTVHDGGEEAMAFPFQALVYLLARDHDHDRLITGYREHDPLPQGPVPYPGLAYLGVPSGEVLDPPCGWTQSGNCLYSDTCFRVSRGTESFTAGWPPNGYYDIPIAWVLAQLKM